MADFKISYEKTCKNEGGYTKDPHETWMGVDRVEIPGWDGWAVIDRLKSEADFPHSLSENADLLQKVEDFFRVNYWQPVHGDDINDQGVADKLYDACVNMGTGTAIRLMQKALGVGVDGSIGPITIGAINAASPEDLLSKFKAARIAHYENIVMNNPEDQKYLHSWISRC